MSVRFAWFLRIMALPGVLGLATAAALVPVAQPVRAAERLPASHLLLRAGSDGSRVAVTNVAGWEQRRASILAGMAQVMGPWPGAEKRVPLAVQVEREETRDGLVCRHLTYAAEPGGRVPAILLMPREAVTATDRRHPAVLALHQTHPAGRRLVVGLADSPDDEYGVALARRGFVVLAPAYPLWADYQPDLAALGWRSGTLKAVWDNQRGLDLLASLPFVRTNRGFGVIGHSLGGHNGVFTAVLDPRLTVVVSSCGLDSFPDYQGGDPAVWRPARPATCPGWRSTAAGSRPSPSISTNSSPPSRRGTCSWWLRPATTTSVRPASTAWRRPPPRCSR